jgi:Xaa-Pro aminopeptidase
VEQAFHRGNRERLYAALPPDSLTVLFSGEPIRKTNDEDYPFFADRNFVYLTGLDSQGFILLAVKEGERVHERLYILPPDPHAERWTGRRVPPAEAEARSGVADVRFVAAFAGEFHALATSGRYGSVCLDLFKVSPGEIDRPAHRFARTLARDYPFLALRSANPLIRALRTVKQPCEIAALRRAEAITGEGILAMMAISRPGLYEYQYKAAFDHALGQHGPEMHGFPPIISAGANNFCIHYYAYSGQARDGDMILNDVGAQYDNLICDVSRGWPCSGRFTDRQRLLYECALATSDELFATIRPGMRMADVDATIRAVNAQRLVHAGVMDSVDQVGDYMWHGGAHHIGYDVHDAVAAPEVLAPGMAFCVDVGIYHESWGVGFRLEDNCLVTEDGCENLSAGIPRTVADIEACIGGRVR